MKKSILKLLPVVMACSLSAAAKAQDLQADNMLLFQRASGGWFKQFHAKAFSYDQDFSVNEKKQIAEEVRENVATIDNGATSKEIRYLVKIYQTVKNPLYLAAAEKGIRYLLKAQYANGGFPQYYPDHGLYRNQITYNDNAMINALTILRSVVLQQEGFDAVDRQLIDSCSKAVSKGVDCIVKTQIRVNGKLTGWCQQYDEKTLQPAKARAYELPSISGNETVGIVRFLMAQQNPSSEIKTAVTEAVAWLTAVKIEGYKVVAVPAPETPRGSDKRLEKDIQSTIWARYYEIENNRPFFCNRDGIKVYSFQELDYERRNGYAWYGNWAQQLLDKDYPIWAKNWL